jgi:hypothetical protein
MIDVETVILGELVGDNIASRTHLEFRRILELGYEMGKLVMVGSIMLSVAETKGEEANESWVLTIIQYCVSDRGHALVAKSHQFEEAA